MRLLLFISLFSVAHAVCMPKLTLGRVVVACEFNLPTPGVNSHLEFMARYGRNFEENQNHLNFNMLGSTGPLTLNLRRKPFDLPMLFLNLTKLFGNVVKISSLTDQEGTSLIILAGPSLPMNLGAVRAGVQVSMSFQDRNLAYTDELDQDEFFDAEANFPDQIYEQPCDMHLSQRLSAIRAVLSTSLASGPATVEAMGRYGFDFDENSFDAYPKFYTQAESFGATLNLRNNKLKVPRVLVQFLKTFFKDVVQVKIIGEKEKINIMLLAGPSLPGKIGRLRGGVQIVLRANHPKDPSKDKFLDAGENQADQISDLTVGM